MSGFLSGIARAGAVAQGIGQAAQNLAGLVDGGGMTALPGGVNIGGIDLQAFEIPESVPWGSLSELVEKRLPGGARIVQMMGAETQPITLTGLMLGPDAADRASLLEQLVWAQTLTTLTFGDFTYSGIVKRFTADYKGAFWQGRYEIEFRTMPDDPQQGAAGDDPNAGDPFGGAGAYANSAMTDVTNGLSSLASTAQGILNAGQVALNSVASIMLPVTNALGIAVPFLSTAQGLFGTANMGLGALGGIVAGAGALSNVSGLMASAGSAVSNAMQASGAAINRAVGNAGADLLSAADLAGTTVASGVQALSAGMGYTANYAQAQVSASTAQPLTPAASPIANWTPATPGVAQNMAAADRAYEQAALATYLNGH